MAAPLFPRAHHQQALHHTKGRNLLYNAHSAATSSASKMARPKLRKLDENLALRGVVINGLARRWSPGRISTWLEHAFVNDESMRISHEAIYSALYESVRLFVCGGLVYK